MKIIINNSFKFFITLKFIIISCFFVPNEAYAKQKIKSQSAEHIIINNKRGFLDPSASKWNKILNNSMSAAKKHCKSFKKDAFWFRGLAHGNQYFKAGTDVMDSDETGIMTYDFRLICANNIENAYQVFKRSIPGYRTELTIRPIGYYKNTMNKYNYMQPENYETVSKSKEKEKIPNIDLSDKEVIPASSGTGFFINNNGYLITNYHVIENCEKVETTFRGDKQNSNIIAFDKVNDLALIKTNFKTKVSYSISDSDPALLQDIIVAGFPLGKKVSSSIKTQKGSVTSLSGFGDNYSQFQIDAALNQGNSGGPIIDQKGNVVGVAVATFGKKEGIESFNFGIKSSMLKNFVNSNSIMYTKTRISDLSNQDLGSLITEATAYLECHMTVANLKKLISQKNSRKAFFNIN